MPKPVTAKARKATAKAQVMPVQAALDSVWPNRVTLLENFAGSRRRHVLGGEDDGAQRGTA
ncbi:MAG TPA: hypothetical protein VF940_32205 [Streptosporangiaceae bacterium]